MKYSVVIGVDHRNFDRNRIEKAIRCIIAAFKEARETEYEIILTYMYSYPEQCFEAEELCRNVKGTVPILATIKMPKDGLFSKPILYNRGVRSSVGNFVITCDVDILWNKSVVKQVRKLIYKKDNVLVGADISFLKKDYCDINRIIDGTVPLNEIEKELNDARKKHWFYGNFHGMWRNDWFEMRGYDERMRIWGEDDNDLFKRCAKKGFELLCLEPHSNYHLHHDSRVVSKNRDEWIKKNKEFRNDKSFVKNDENWGTSSSNQY